LVLRGTLLGGEGREGMERRGRGDRRGTQREGKGR